MSNDMPGRNKQLCEIQVLCHIRKLQSQHKSTCVMLHTYHDDGESSDGVVRELQLLLYRDRDVAIGRGLVSRPVAVALDSSPLLKVGQHDNRGGVLLPHHPPEVHNAVRDRALSSDEAIGLFVALMG